MQRCLRHKNPVLNFVLAKNFHFISVVIRSWARTDGRASDQARCRWDEEAVCVAKDGRTDTVAVVGAVKNDLNKEFRDRKR